MPAVRSGLQAARLDVAQAEIWGDIGRCGEIRGGVGRSHRVYLDVAQAEVREQQTVPSASAEQQAVLTAQNSLLHQQVAQMQHMMQQQQVT